MRAAGCIGQPGLRAAWPSLFNRPHARCTPLMHVTIGECLGGCTLSECSASWCECDL